MEWKFLSESTQIEQILSDSFNNHIAIFKHSTRCSISHMAKGRLEREIAPSGIDFYFLDLLNHRDLSNIISAKFSVHHESPQVLLLRNGECIYDESHSGITMQDIADQLKV